MTFRYVFTYGSLLNPASMARSLPEIDLKSCFPARLSGFRREFSVAFPNDGTQTDKAYFKLDGSRPAVVLFCNVVISMSTNTNGVCLPVSVRELAQLMERELRYNLIDVSELISTTESGRKLHAGEVGVFVGKPEFTAQEAIKRGVVPRSYLRDVIDGTEYWDSQSRGFRTDFYASTILPEPEDVMTLRRINI